MGFLKLLFFLFLSPLTYATNYCPASTCSRNGFQVKFPFTLQSHKSKNCGFPGFELSCNNHTNSVTLNLPISGKFLVRNINYSTQSIYLNDPYNCLPRRLFNFSLLGSPFNSVNSQMYTLLRCPSDFMKSSITPIKCLSNSTHNVIATDSLFLAPLMPPCEKVATLEIPISSPFMDLVFSELSDNLELKWDLPKCRVCEATGGVCGFKNNVTHEVICSKRGKISRLKLFEIIALTITLPAITCTTGIAIARYITERILMEARVNGTTHQNRRRRRPRPTSMQQNSVSSTRRGGLDREPPTTTVPATAAIVDYEKEVIGESIQMAGSNSSTCPICLSEFKTREALGFIPECNHCFHAECIDKWLLLKSSCPVCRNSPSSVLVTPYHI